MVLPNAGVLAWKLVCTLLPVDDRTPMKSVELVGSTVAPIRPPLANETCGPLKAAVANASGEVFSTTSLLPMKNEVRPFWVSLNVVNGVTVCVPPAFSTVWVFGNKD